MHKKKLDVLLRLKKPDQQAAWGQPLFSRLALAPPMEHLRERSASLEKEDVLNDVTYQLTALERVMLPTSG